MSMYYTRITLKRMSELLGLSETETEEALSQLVVSSVVRAKIDRPAGVVHFRYRIFNLVLYHIRSWMYLLKIRSKKVSIFIYLI